MPGSLVNLYRTDSSYPKSTVSFDCKFVHMSSRALILSVILIRSDREKDSVALMNTAIYKCPLANCKSMSGLAESLMLLSQGYLTLGRLEDALHSICLSVDFASERYEEIIVRVLRRISRDINYLH